MSKKNLIVLLVSVLILCAGIIIYLVDTKPSQQKDTKFQTTLDIGGVFTLTNQNGEIVSSDIYKDKYKLVYFGFTHCPAICPTELQKISTAITQLGEAGKGIQPIFISVDPERDTPAVLKEYVTLFPHNLVGFTGSIDHIEKVKKQYRIYAAKIQDPSASDYTLDHSSYIYFLDRDSKMIELFNTHDTAENIVDRIKPLLEKQ